MPLGEKNIRSPHDTDNTETTLPGGCPSCSAIRVIARGDCHDIAGVHVIHDAACPVLAAAITEKETSR